MCDTEGEYLKINVIVKYLTLEKKMTCILLRPLKEEVYDAFQQGLVALNKKIKRFSLPSRLPNLSRLPEMFGGGASANNRNSLLQPHALYSLSELNNLNIHIQWIKDDTSLISISFKEQKDFYKTWFEKAMIEFCRSQMMATHHLL